MLLCLVIIMEKEKVSKFNIEFPVKENRNVPYKELRRTIENIYGSEIIKIIENNHIPATNSNTYFIFP